jgi:hypothetical protein
VRQKGAATVWQVSGAAIAAFVGLWLGPMTGARAETPEVSPGGAVGLGNRGWSAAEKNHAASVDELEFSARAGLASDYIYRGTTLSDHGPAAGAAVEATFGPLYAGSTVATVKLPTQPIAEFTMAGGVRPKLANIDFDLGVTYFGYPGERLPGETHGINYWEAAIRGDRSIGESIRIASLAVMPTLRMSPTPAPGVNMWRPGWALTCQSVCSRRTWACRSRLPPAIPGSVIRLRTSAAFPYLPISIGRQA